MKHPNAPAKFFALILIGAGLIIVGVMLFMVLTPPTDPQGFSVLPAEVNFPAPQLSVEDLAGGSVSLENYRGRVVLVNLWATWCPPCKAEMPTLQAFYVRHQGKGFVIVGINDGETLDLVKPFVMEYDLTFPVWLDEGYQAERAFNTMNLPSSYVVDRTGIIRLAWVGAISQRSLEAYVLPIIKE